MFFGETPKNGGRDARATPFDSPPSPRKKMETNLTAIVLSFTLLTNLQHSATDHTLAVGDSKLPMHQVVAVTHGTAVVAFKLPDGRVSPSRPIQFIMDLKTNYTLSPLPSETPPNPAMIRVPTRKPSAPAAPPLPPGLK
jgi:hypothetical protein